MSELLADLAVDLIPRQAGQQGRGPASEEWPWASQWRVEHNMLSSPICLRPLRSGARWGAQGSREPVKRSLFGGRLMRH